MEKIYGNLRKFTEIYAKPRARAARAPCIDFLPVIGTVDLDLLNLATGSCEPHARFMFSLVSHMCGQV